MERPAFLSNVLVRNLAGLSALLLVHYLSDQYVLEQRSGFNRFSPYLFVLLLYGWLVFHNRVLFEKLYLKGKKVAYVSALLLCLTLGSLNQHYILRTSFGVAHTLPHLLSYWLYTLTGLGVFVLYRHLRVPQAPPSFSTIPEPAIPKSSTTFDFTTDGVRYALAYSDILYLESLENYVKLHTRQKVHLLRLTLKEAEERLPRPLFVRISRSHLVNTAQLERSDPDRVQIAGQLLRIGKVYKRYVAEQLTASTPG
jgi:hypothetical protein